VINRTPFMLVRCSRDLHYRFVSQAYAQLVGVRREEILGKTIAEAIGDKGFNTLRPHIEKVLRGEAREFDCEIDFPRSGRAACISPTGRKAMRRARSTAGSLPSSTSPSKAAPCRRASSSPASSNRPATRSSAKTLDGIIVSWNSAAENLFGYAAEEVIGQVDHHPPFRRSCMTRSQRSSSASRRGDSLDHYETIRQRKDGSRFPVSLSVSPVKDAHGAIVGASKIAATSPRASGPNMSATASKASCASSAKSSSKKSNAERWSATASGTSPRICSASRTSRAIF